MTNTHGGHRENSGRKAMPEHLKRKPRKFYLNEAENEQVNEFITKLKQTDAG